MEIRIKLDHPKAVLPTRAHSADAGIDLTSVSVTHTSDYLEYDTGVIVEIPKNHVGLVFPRSSISKYDLYLKNSVAVIDSGYLGTVKLRFGTREYGVNKLYVVGDRIGQLIIIPYPEYTFKQVDNFEATERDNGSFGSSGN